jgi:maleylacetate reductase
MAGRHLASIAVRPGQIQGAYDRRVTERDFSWLDGERLIRFGAGTAGLAPALLAQRGFEGYALLTTSRTAVAAPRELVEGASIALHVPSGPVPEASAAVRHEVEGRPIVAVGGGRVIDSAKAIAGADGLVVAAMPTTLSGAPMTRFHRMPEGVERYTFTRPALVLADPGLMASQPEQQRVASAMNALAHAMESLYTPLANPMAETAALKGAELIREGIEGNDGVALSLGCLLGGYAVGSAGLAFHHALCQTIVRLGGTPHAETNAVVLPHSARLAETFAPREIALFADALGNIGTAQECVAFLAARCGYTRLSELQFDAGLIPEVAAQAAAHPGIASTPGDIREGELRSLLEAAL